VIGVFEVAVAVVAFLVAGPEAVIVVEAKPIVTGFVESTVNEVVSKRFCKPWCRAHTSTPGSIRKSLACSYSW